MNAQENNTMWGGAEKRISCQMWREQNFSTRTCSIKVGNIIYGIVSQSFGIFQEGIVLQKSFSDPEHDWMAKQLIRPLMSAVVCVMTVLTGIDQGVFRQLSYSPRCKFGLRRATVAHTHHRKMHGPTFLLPSETTRLLWSDNRRFERRSAARTTFASD